jgi:AhpD family alkylhydroperoxidase
VEQRVRYEELRQGLRRLSREVPGPMTGFSRLHHDAVADGALGTSVKELMALAVAICTHCEGCITFHVRGALLAGATREQVLETIAVAVMMGGGPATIFGIDALDVLDDAAPAAPAAPSEGVGS